MLEYERMSLYTSILMLMAGFNLVTLLGVVAVSITRKEIDLAIGTVICVVIAVILKATVL